jgi:hypothetical protein
MVRKILLEVTMLDGVTHPSFPSARAIAEEYGRRVGVQPPSVWTVRRDLRALGAVCRVRRFVPCSDPVVHKKRLLFAKEWADKSDSELARVVFSDEPFREPFRITGAEYIDRCIVPLHNTAAMVGRRFLQDNARIHTARSTMQKMSELGWSVVEHFPPYSPDLNPVERVWALMKLRVSELHPPKEVGALAAAATTVWKGLRQSELDSVCRGWRRALERCLERGGKP